MKIWKSITLGTKTRAQLLKEVRSKCSYISSYAEDLIKKTTVQKKKETIDVCVCQVKDLGFTQMPTTTELYKKVKEKGDLVPAEVALHALLDFKEDYWITFLHKFIADSYGDPNLFDVVPRGGGVKLSHFWAGPDVRWALGSCFAFRLRKLEPSEPLTLEPSLDSLNFISLNGVSYVKVDDVLGELEKLSNSLRKK